MPVRRSPNGARHVRPQPGRNRPERVVAINRNAWSQSVGTGGRNHPVRASNAANDQAVQYEADRVVMTIPVNLDGAGRRRLRDAARKAGIGIVQFVHEPLAALYAHLRSQPNYRQQLAELDGCRVLVFDWGGGTLDLTLCQVQGDQIIQIANTGDDEVGGDRFDEYHCVDPRPGRATFTFARPIRAHVRDAKLERQAYATFHLAVDEMADPLMERLHLKVAIDHDYVAHVDLRSTMREDHIKAEIFDLEFTVQFPPSTGNPPGSPSKEPEGARTENELASVAGSSMGERIRLRSNIAVNPSWQKVPGDLVPQYREGWFDDRTRQYSDWQKKERDYYKDCPYCHRSRYEFRMQGCNEMRCLWLRAYPTVSAAHSMQMPEEPK